MNTSQLQKTISQKYTINQKDVKKILCGFVNLSKDILKKGESLCLKGFGKFYIQKTPQRNYKNLKTGRNFRSTPKAIIKFKMSNSYKYSIC